MNNLVEIKEFKHEVFGDLRVVRDEKDEVWFVARDISIKLGYKSIEKMYDHVDKEDKVEINPQSQQYQELGGSGTPLESNPNIFRMVLINERGVLSAIQSSETSRYKKKLLLEELGLEGYIVLESRPEIEFGEQLILFTSRIGYAVKSQYKVLDYYIDFYIPELNIAIEYDEYHHKSQNEADKQRELKIKEEIGCKFVRVEDGLNIGTQLGIVAKTMMEEM